MQLTASPPSAIDTTKKVTSFVKKGMQLRFKNRERRITIALFKISSIYSYKKKRRSTMNRKVYLLQKCVRKDNVSEPGHVYISL